MLTSLCINNPVHIDAYLLHCELTDKDIDFIEESLKNYDINIIPLKINRQVFSEKVPVNNMWSIETYFRLMLTYLLPDTVNRILYLDVDIIVNKDISELYNMVLNGSALAGAYDRNGYGTTLEQLDSPKQREMFGKLAGSEPFYFNAGVLLYNIDWMKQNNISLNTYVNALNDWNFEMPAFDQDILNYVFFGKVKYIDWEKYNLFTLLAFNDGAKETDAEKASILHFSSSYKPWTTNSIHYEIEDIWWRYAKRSSIYSTIADQYITGMTQDPFLKQYTDYLLTQTETQKKTIDDQNNTISVLKNSLSEQNNVILEQKEVIDQLVKINKKLVIKK